MLPACLQVAAHCPRRPADRPCRALDLGSNNGWMASYMLQLGSRVVAVEPANDFAAALKESAALSCSL